MKHKAHTITIYKAGEMQTHMHKTRGSDKNKLQGEAHWEVACHK